MAKLGMNVRLRGTTLEGYVYKRIASAGELFYRVQWDYGDAPDSRLYTADELENGEASQKGEGKKYSMDDHYDRHYMEQFKLQVERE